MYYFHTAFLLSMLFIIIILVPERNTMYKRKWVQVIDFLCLSIVCNKTMFLAIKKIIVKVLCTLQHHKVLLTTCYYIHLYCKLCLKNTRSPTLHQEPPDCTHGCATLSAAYVCEQSTYRITALQYTYGCTTLSAAYLLAVYLLNHWVTLHFGCATLSAA